VLGGNLLDGAHGGGVDMCGVAGGADVVVA